MSLKSATYLSTMFQTGCVFYSGLVLPYLMPINISMLETESQSNPFNDTSVPMPVPIYGINSVSTPRYSFRAKKTLSQQLRGRPTGKFLGRSQKFLNALSCNLSTVDIHFPHAELFSKENWDLFRCEVI